jgi:GntR family transcriptional regulator / MocR family aminotransferase
MEPLLDLPIRLPARGKRDLLREVHRQLKAAILDGRLQPGLRLPATRALATQLGISRNTAVLAYDLLLSEGCLETRPGAGTFVAAVRRPPVKLRRAASQAQRLNPFWRRRTPIEAPAAHLARPFSFRVGLPDKASVPLAVWRRLSARALRGLSKAPAFYAEPEGRRALREAIAQHVSFARAVACRLDDIVVTSGAQQAFGLLARILVMPGKTVVALEEPGYPPLRLAFAAAGARIAPVPVDAEGLMVDRLPKDVRVICVTPSHQFPLGMAMSARRRAALLDFAAASGAVVIEDDYDGEFRLGGRPLDALQTMDRADSVFYVGTFSKSLFPALRLGFVVAPGWARTALVAARQLQDWHSAVLAQDTLAAFIAEGHLARHIRKMRRLYRTRRSVLLQSLAAHGGGLVSPIQADAGLHLAALLPRRIKAETVATRAGGEGVAVEPISRYATGKAAPNGLVLGYGSIAAERIEEAVVRLALSAR